VRWALGRLQPSLRGGPGGSRRRDPPDLAVVVAESGPGMDVAVRLGGVARDLGGLQSFSDRVGELDDGGLDTVRALLTDGGSLNVPSPGRIAAAVGLALKRHRHEPAGRQSLADRIDPYVELLHPDDAVEPRPVRLTRTSDGLEPGATEG
jgi:hypothetical protein